MKDETKKKIKKGALIALQFTLGGFALLGMISTGALVKSCSKGEINTTAVVATTPVVGQRVKKAQINDLTGTEWVIRDDAVNAILGNASYTLSFSSNSTDYTGISTAKSGSRPSSSWNISYGNTEVYNAIDGWTAEVYRTISITGGTDASNPDLIAWLQANATEQTPSGAPITYDYAYCAPVGTLPDVVPLDYTSVTLQFQADSGYGFPDTGGEIPGYTQIYSEGLVIDSYTYGGYLGNGMYNAIEIQCSRDSDPPADSCHISVSALSTSGFEYPEWKTLRVLGTHCTIYMANDQFDADGVVRLQAYPDTGYYFDQDMAFIGNQLKEYYGAEVVVYDLSTGGLYLTIRKNSENLVLNESPYIEITPLAGSVPVGGGDMGQAFDLLRDGFSALLPLFMIQVLPGITLGMLFMVPFIVILILFILKVVHK